MVVVALLLSPRVSEGRDAHQRRRCCVICASMYTYLPVVVTYYTCDGDGLSKVCFLHAAVAQHSSMLDGYGRTDIEGAVYSSPSFFFKRTMVDKGFYRVLLA